ncbi:MAG: transglycosylase domain-containing protein [Prevotella sp.]|nr:transglycosylase domain-containing protein [Prevotella sp.]
MKKAVKFMLKILKLLLAVFVPIAAAFLAVSAVRGYSMHRNALEKCPPAQMAKLIREEDFARIDELPEFYIRAVICAEDKRFYDHCGVDPKAIARAFVHDLKAMSPEQGGSTVTQQLAKNFYYTREKRLERKFAEIFTALSIEKEFSKDEIFELYVNSIYFGDGYYGIAAAAEGYFGKSPSQLDERECAMLAGIPNAPSAYSLGENPELAEQRLRQVLDRMTECDEITEERAAEIFSSVPAQGKINPANENIKGNTPLIRHKKIEEIKPAETL